jgi:hypothetical protein
MNAIANNILAQLGGNKFLAMYGVKSMVYGENSLMFAIGRGALNKANKVRVTLDVDDVYTVEFFSVRGINCISKGKYTNVYADNLRQVMKTATGFDTSL